MRATFTEEQETLAATARDLAEGGREAARSVLDGGELPREPTKSLLTGFSPLGVPEEAGGAGGDLVDLAILLRALGEQVVPTPFVSHVVAVQTAHTAGLDVSAPAAGETRWTLAEADSEAAAIDISDTVTGTCRAVRDGHGAHAALLLSGDQVALATPSETRRRDALDATRPMADLRFDGTSTLRTPAGPDARLPATVAVAAELTGVGFGSLELAVDYANVREQFGQPVGKFQGVAHQLADAWTAVENAWSLVLYACWAVSAGVTDAPQAVHAAKASAGSAAVHAAERCTQVHGGIGITWEADPHLYLRRALTSDVWLGNARWHRQRLGAAILSA